MGTVAPSAPLLKPLTSQLGYLRVDGEVSGVLGKVEVGLEVRWDECEVRLSLEKESYRSSVPFCPGHTSFEK
jgi:hypothetical protein